MENTSYLLETKDICKEFNRVRVLSNINFNLRSGEIHSLVGENGAGKSTFVKILSGVYQADDGKMVVKNEEVSFNSVKESEKSGILTIHQEINLVPYFNLFQNIFIGKELQNRFGFLEDKKMAEEAEKVLAKLNMKLDVYKTVSNFNTSLQRIVQICSALVCEPEILIFDEPTTALGEEERERLLQIIEKLRDTGIGIIYISHNIDEILKISDRVTVFRDGIKVDTIPKEKINSKTIVSMMMGNKDYEIFERKVNKKNCEEIFRVENLVNNKLRGINFSICKGEILGVAGVIGAGKSEIARAIFGVDDFKTGKFFINGREYKPKSTKSVDMGIALVPEERRIQGLVENFPLFKNVTLAYLNSFADNLFIKKSLERETTSKKINELSIRTTGPQQITKYLSGGNQQKIVLSKWLCGKFDMLILDEPTKGIDINAKRDIYKLIHDLSDEGKAILFLSSYLPEMLNFCDRILVIKDGNVVGEYPSTGPRAKETITHAMLGGKVEC